MRELANELASLACLLAGCPDRYSSSDTERCRMASATTRVESAQTTKVCCVSLNNSGQSGVRAGAGPAAAASARRERLRFSRHKEMETTASNNATDNGAQNHQVRGFTSASEAAAARDSMLSRGSKTGT